MEERQRVKIVDYVGSKKVEQSKIEEELKKKGITIRLDSFIDPGLVRRVAGRRPRPVRREGLPVRRGQAGDQGSLRRAEARAPDVQHRRGSEGQDPRGGLHRQQGDQRRRSSAKQMKENKARRLVLVHHGRRHLQGRQVRRRRRQGHRRTTATAATSRRASASRSLKILEDSKDGKVRFVQLRIPVTEGSKLQGRQLHVRRQHGRQREGAAPALQAELGRVLQREEDPQGAREGARGLRHRRLLRVHGLPGSVARATSRQRTGRHARRTRPPPGPPAPAAAKARAARPSST